MALPVVFGKKMVFDGFVCSQAACQDVLGSRLDELVKMVLDEGLHDDCGVNAMVGKQLYFLN